MSPWKCTRCTFDNAQDVPKCAICETERTEPVQSIDADYELAKQLQQQYLEEEKTHETTPTNTNNTSTSASPTNTNNAPPTDNTMDTSSQRPTTRSVRVVPQTSGTFTSYTSAQIKRERDHEMELAASTDTVPPMIEIKHEPYDAPFLFSNTPCGPSSYDMSWVTCVESDDDNEDVEDVEDVEEEDDNEDSPYIYDSEATESEPGAGGLEGVGRGRGRGCNVESDLNGLEGVGRGRGRGCGRGGGGCGGRGRGRDEEHEEVSGGVSDEDHDKPQPQPRIEPKTEIKPEIKPEPFKADEEYSDHRAVEEEIEKSNPDDEWLPPNQRTRRKRKSNRKRKRNDKEEMIKNPNPRKKRKIMNGNGSRVTKSAFVRRMNAAVQLLPANATLEQLMELNSTLNQVQKLENQIIRHRTTDKFNEEEKKAIKNLQIKNETQKSAFLKIQLKFLQNNEKIRTIGAIRKQFKRKDKTPNNVSKCI
eukprot:807881_1